MRRGHFTEDVRKELIIRAGARCSRPNCWRETLGPSRNITSKGQVLGVAAHIKAASIGGPRYDPEQTEIDRHSVENGLWLCERCASQIDKNNGADFSVEDLRLWKRTSERVALERLEKQSEAVLANCVSTLIFVNVPRLCQYILLKQPEKQIPRDFIDGIPSDRYIALELLELQKAIKNLQFSTLNWEEMATLVEDPSGMLVSFEARFWTKNGPKNRDAMVEPDFTDLSKAPHVYTKKNKQKFILPYDPRFLTTNTAFSEMSAGRVRIGGFGLIKYVNGDDIIASPLFFGIASTPEARAFGDAFSS